MACAPMSATIWGGRAEALAEARDTFECFGSVCAVLVTAAGQPHAASRAVSAAKDRLLEWHGQFSRFEPGSELSRLNASADATVAVSPLMARFAQSVRDAAIMTGGLVDATLVDEIERAGYRSDLKSAPVPLRAALALAPPRGPGRPNARAAWRSLSVDRTRGTISRPPGVRLDSGGLVKGLFVDVLAHALARHASFAIDCGGDIRLGGTRALTRPVHVASPFDDSILHTFELTDAALATSGIGKRSWLDDDGRPAHHLLDPATGRPAYTGIVQATAIAPTGVIAEALSKAALLSGPAEAGRWLRRGGVVVYDDGSHRVFDPR